MTKGVNGWSCLLGKPTKGTANPQHMPAQVISAVPMVEML